MPFGTLTPFKRKQSELWKTIFQTCAEKDPMWLKEWIVVTVVNYTEYSVMLID